MREAFLTARFGFIAKITDGRELWVLLRDGRDGGGHKEVEGEEREGEKERDEERGELYTGVQGRVSA